MAQKNVQSSSISEDKLSRDRHQTQLQHEEINNISVASQANTGRLTPNLPRPDLFTGDRKEYLKTGVPLYEAAIRCDWNVANTILKENHELVKYSITENGETALHVAASAKGDPKNVKEFVRKLVDLMDEKDLEFVNKNFNTALYLAAVAGNIETVKIMVKKNSNLLRIPGAEQMLPLHAAALFGNYDVVKYLYKQSNELDGDCWNSENRALLLKKCVENDMFDIALEIVKLDPTRILDGGIILGVLARKPKAFGETQSNNIWITVKSVFTSIGSKVGAHEKENQALQLLRIIWKDISEKPRDEIDSILRGPADSVKRDKSASGRVLQAIQLRQLISEHLGKMETDTKNIIHGRRNSTTQETNSNSTKVDRALQLNDLISKYCVSMHTESQAIVKQQDMPVGKGDHALERLQKLISKQIVNFLDETQDTIKQGTEKEDQTQRLQKVIFKNIGAMRTAIKLKASYSSRILFIAAEMGNTKFLVELIHKYPDLIWKVNDEGLSIFHIAVKHRHEGIYNLLYEIGAMKDLITPLVDEHENNMLHLVGKRAKQKQLEDVSGVALQMQRELLWFQEVKKMIPPSYRERKNGDGLTPHELFTIEHNELVTHGEKWMKETASQCMVVAALIATIVFAAAFTVPGGYDQNNGIPIFHSKATFVVFVVADAISLFMSSASILIFLSILTSRYAESDFLYSLPKKLISGLLTLFLSITTMTVTFGVSFFVLYQNGLLWMPILISLFGVLPVLLYISLQYDLFSDVIRSTYRSRYLFKPKKRVLYYENPKL